MSSEQPSNVVSPLGAALEKARGDMSMREAARRAKISLTWWRYVVAGGHYVRGHFVPVEPSVDAVIAMAQAVGVSVADALTLAGYEAEAHPWKDERVSSHVRETLADAILHQELTPKEVERIYAVLRERRDNLTDDTGDTRDTDDSSDNIGLTA